MLQRVIQLLSLIYTFIFAMEMPCGAEAARQTSVAYSGIITKSGIGLDGNPEGTQSVYTFHAEVSSDRYRITLVAIQDLSCFEQVAGSDGMDCYFQQKMWRSWADKVANADFKETAQVTPGSYPSLTEPPLQLVWMMLASHNSLTNNQPIVITRIDDAPDDKLQAKIKYSESFNWLQTIEMYAPGILLLDGKEYPIPHPYENGYKLWDLNVNATSKTNGLTFPQNARFSRYATYMSGSGNPGIRKFSEIEILVTNVFEGSLSSSGYLPLLSHKNLSAIDYRFSSTIPKRGQAAVDVIQYQLPNGQWLDRSNSHVNYIGMSLKMETRQTSNKISHIQKAIIFGVFALSTIIFLGFLLKRKSD